MSSPRNPADPRFYLFGNDLPRRAAGPAAAGYGGRAFTTSNAAPVEDFGEWTHASLVEQFAPDPADRDKDLMAMLPDGYDPAVCDLDRMNRRLSR